MAPHNPTVNQLFGVNHGLAMGVLTFDWGQIAYNGSPLPIPWWAMANVAVTVVFFFWFLLPVLYVRTPYFSFFFCVTDYRRLQYSDVWYSAYLPMVSSHSFDNTGSEYNVSRIINGDSTFNIQAYQEYSPLFLSASFAIAYGLSFASITSTLTHTFLYYRQQIWTQARRSLSEQPDIHARLMSVYREVPDSWYMIIFGSFHLFLIQKKRVDVFSSYHVCVRCRSNRGVGHAISCMGIRACPHDLCVFPRAVSFSRLTFAFLAMVYTVPIGVIQAITNQQVGLNVITELIIGYALPGRPIAMMMFKTWGYITMVQALQFTSDFKLGHYMKIAPRLMFFCQIVATVVAGTVQLGVQAWMFSNVEDLCSPNQKDGFICPSTTVFGTASIIVSCHAYFFWVPVTQSCRSGV